jgi:hypothetical protein
MMNQSQAPGARSGAGNHSCTDEHWRYGVDRK